MEDYLKTKFIEDFYFKLYDEVTDENRSSTNTSEITNKLKEWTGVQEKEKMILIIKKMSDMGLIEPNGMTEYLLKDPEKGNY